MHKIGVPVAIYCKGTIRTRLKARILPRYCVKALDRASARPAVLALSGVKTAPFNCFALLASRF